MSQPVLLQDDWARGQRQDEPRMRALKAVAWGLVDWIPGLGAPLRKRGGWSYGSNDISAVHAGTTHVAAVVYAEFATPLLVAIGQGGQLFTINLGTLAVTNVGAALASPQTPVLHAGKLIIPASDGTTAPMYYDGTTLAALAGSPPAAKYAAVYKDRTVLAHTSAQKTRAYFSAAADPTSWDTTSAWQSVGAPITGLAALPNALLLFQDTRASRIRGATPPPGSDMVVDDPIFNVGCTDARSIVVFGSYCVFANPLGVFLSNGTNLPTDVTEAVGWKRYWVELLASYSTTWTLAAGNYRGLYVITVMDGSTFKDCIVFDIPRGIAYRIANLKGVCFDNAVTIGEELYVGLRSAARVAKFSSIFSPAAGVKNDADGTAVTPVLETMIYGGKPGVKRWLDVYLDVDIRDAATDDPLLTVSYIKAPEDAYTALTPTISETTTKTRKKIPLRVKSDAIGLKIAQTNASSDTRLYSIEADVHTREGSALT